ncbi:MAG TPA: DUF4911 domain-containing protein [Syntrophorhabdaceae bacterium]|nr:DUF4911 domain-containing protein [Syntrophorhabdaceae bacterium]
MEKTKRFIINRDGIGFFKSVLESYEDIGIFSVLDGSQGVIEVLYSGFFEHDLYMIIKDMANYGIEFNEVIHV